MPKSYSKLKQTLYHFIAFASFDGIVHKCNPLTKSGLFQLKRLDYCVKCASKSTLISGSDGLGASFEITFPSAENNINLGILNMA